MAQPSSSDQFRFRLNCIDHYQASQSPLDPALPASSDVTDEAEAPKLPIIRIFGATETGQKVCAHIHGAFPYLFVEYHGDLDEAEVRLHIQTFAASVNQALALSFRRNPYEKSLTSYVAFISLVRGVPFYGYHVGYKHFLKIYLRNPGHMTRLADLFAQGAILAKVIQPYESHLQYLLQWMCDYNLYGCGFVDCKQVQFRHPLPSAKDMESKGHKWHDKSINYDQVLDPFEYPRQSHCMIEVDVQVQDILNREEVVARNTHHNFKERLLDLELHQKFVPSMAGLWRDETVRRKKKLGLGTKDPSPFPPEALVTMSADPRLTRGNWVHEQSLLGQIGETIKRERFERQDEYLEFETFYSQPVTSKEIRTVYESVEDLFPGNIGSSSYCLTQAACTDVTVLTLADHTQHIVDEISILRMESAEQEKIPLDGLIYRGDANPAEHVPQEQQLELSKSSRMPTPQYKHKISSSQPERGTGSWNVYQELPKRKQSDVDLAHSTSSVPDHIESGFAGTKVANKGPEKPQPSTSLERPAPGVASSQHCKRQDSNQHTANHAKQQSLSFPIVKRPFNSDIRTPKLQPISVSQPAIGLHRVAPKSRIRFATDGIIDRDPKRAAKRKQGTKSEPIACKLRGVLTGSSRLKMFRRPPPSPEHVSAVIEKSRRPTIIYKQAHYGIETDSYEQPNLPNNEVELRPFTDPAISEFYRKSRHIETFKLSNREDALDTQEECHKGENVLEKCLFKNWWIGKPPPTKKRVERWIRRTELNRENSTRDLLVEGSRQRSGATVGTSKSRVPRKLKPKPKRKPTSIKHELQYMSVMSLEVHVRTRGELVPNPTEDEIQCIFWSVQNEPENTESTSFTNGIVMLASDLHSAMRFKSLVGAKFHMEITELALINRLVDIVRDLDPDVLVGYEVHNGSWGYLIERARLKFELDLCNDLSRVNFGSRGRFGKEADRWGFTHTSTIRVTGRHMLNVWRAMRGELNLLQYTVENVVFRLLRRRIPHYSFETLTVWYGRDTLRDTARVLNYFLSRTQLNLKILASVDMVAKTSEQARLLGVDFFSVISRGSQFKVESLMFRIAKPESYVLISPSRKQVGEQNALECLPLVMEPQSNFYPSPVLVFDFQSLYPSLMIAYNYCYSTCLGRVANWNGRNKVGFTDYHRHPGILELSSDQINVAPNGLVYVRPQMRKSLLAKMLTEILETRIMVKSGMKQDKKDKALQRLLNNRQLALKLIANVTYGYTSASFSGRMPASEIADSIVQSGRETLERAIALIHSVQEWGAEVVYGDTDSLFVHLKGKSREEAFKLGKEIAETVTKANPRPVKLKFEKVYHPCILLAKKRYVGYKYEHPGQKIPDFDAKGIETVRRDGTPAEQRIEEKALRILFQSKDLSRVKEYFQNQCTKIMAGDVNIQEFLFAKEVKLGSYSERGLGPPGALIATRKLLDDPRLEPQYGERVPYVVVAGSPGARLIDRCVAPEVLLKDDQKELDADYYITKNIIPPLERIFTLVGANVRSWYEEMPKKQRLRSVYNMDAEIVQVSEPEDASGAVKQTLETYMLDTSCFICNAPFSALLAMEEHALSEEANSSDDDLPEADDGNHDDSEDEGLSDSEDNESSEEEEDYANTPAGNDITLPLHELEELRGIICNGCLSNSHASMHTLHRDMADIESRVAKINNVCQDCSVLPFGQPVMCDSRDCPVYYARVKETNTMRSVQAKVRVLTGKFLSESNDFLDF